MSFNKVKKERKVHFLKKVKKGKKFFFHKKKI